MYICVYDEVDRNLGTKTYGFLVNRNKKFKSFEEAVRFSRKISNTNSSIIGKPVIEEMNTKEIK
jgi:hypothetical protein